MHVEPYGVALATALVVVVLCTDRRLRSRGGSLIDRPAIILAILVGAALGGRLHFLAEHLWSGASGPEVARLASPLHGGSTFFGAIAGVAVALVLLRRRLPGRSLGAFADASVVGSGVAILIGRIGCLLQGCCRGRATDAMLGLPSPLLMGGAERFHPFALELGLWAVAAALLARRFFGGDGPSGREFLAFAALFGAGRFFLEFLRDAPVSAGWPSLQQWESAALFVVACAALSFSPMSRAERVAQT